MTQETFGLAMLALLVVAIMLGFPTAFTLMALGVIFGYLGFGLGVYGPNALLVDFGVLSVIFNPDQARLVFDLLVQRTFAVMTNDVLISVPLFIFMGYIVERAGILDRLFRSIQLAMGPVRGSLAIATLATCTIFATATGIVGASVTLMGLLALPAMLRSKYDIKLSTGVIAAGGTLGILIPPSVLLILYGATAGVSVPRLYAGAFLPGLMLALLYLVYIVVRVNLNPSLGPTLPKEERTVPLGQVAVGLLTSFLPITALILAVLGSILAGLATPSEAAALGALGGLILAAAYRKLSFPNLKESVFLTIRTSAMVGWLFVGSSLFAAVFARLGGSAVIERFVLGLGLTDVQFLWLALAVIFLLGWPLEWTEIIVIFMPLFLPLVQRFQIDPLFFGIMVAINLQTAFLSPPVAMSAFYLKGVAPKHVTLNQIFAGMMPFMAIQVAALVVLFLFPQLASWLPNLIYGAR